LKGTWLADIVKGHNNAGSPFFLDWMAYRTVEVLTGNRLSFLILKGENGDS